jgi:hypothetical protein
LANRTASLYIRITATDGKRPYCKPVYVSKGRLKPQYAMVGGEPKYHPEGVYYDFSPFTSTRFTLLGVGLLPAHKFDHRPEQSIPRLQPHPSPGHIPHHDIHARTGWPHIDRRRRAKLR